MPPAPGALHKAQGSRFRHVLDNAAGSDRRRAQPDGAVSRPYRASDRLLHMPSRTARLEVSRRAAIKLVTSAMAASMAGCGRPEEEIIPYAQMPEGLVPGEPMRFATTLCLSGYGRGFVAIAVDGHPIKIEGNPRHPFSLGATDVFAEAEVLALYDPDRSTVARKQGQIAIWEDFAADWARASASSSPGKLALVTGRIVSPTEVALIGELKRRFPNLRWYRYEPVNDDSARAGARLAFGRVLNTLPRLAEADVVL